MDLGTGASSTKRRRVIVVAEERKDPANWRQKKIGFNRQASRVSMKGSSFMGAEGEAPVSSSMRQYRIVSSNKPEDIHYSRLRRYYNQAHAHALTWINNYLHWTFHASFIQLALASYFYFMLLITVFSVFIYWADYHQPHWYVLRERTHSEHFLKNSFGSSHHGCH
jgi:hypothetical protein